MRAHPECDVVFRDDHFAVLGREGLFRQRLDLFAGERSIDDEVGETARGARRGVGEVLVAFGGVA